MGEGKTAEPGVFSSFIQMAPTEICTHSLPSQPSPPQNTHPSQDVPEVANYGPKGFAKMAFLLQPGQKQQPGSGGRTYEGSLLFLRAGKRSVTQQVGEG